MISRLFKRGSLWSFGIYAVHRPFTPDLELGKPLKLFNSRKLRLFGPVPHTQADPFLLVGADTLFIFYEQMYPGRVGEIACSKTTDLQRFENCGVVLSEPHHLSWPFVFRTDAGVYMIPESARANKVTLYRCDELPGPFTPVRTLCTGAYADPFLIQHDSHWYLFATSKAGLELFMAPDLLNGEFVPHPRSPVSRDIRYCRSGGGPLRIGGNWVRAAQDGSTGYGTNVSLIEITLLTPERYEERTLVESFFERNDFWNRDGAHHLSVAEFKGRTVIAADGKHPDYWINKFFRSRQPNPKSRARP